MYTNKVLSDLIKTFQNELLEQALKEKASLNFTETADLIKQYGGQ